MREMSLCSSGSRESGLYERLLNVLDKAYATGVNNDMISGWLHDCTFAAVAVYMVKQAISDGKRTERELEHLVSSLEAVNFNVYGDPTMRVMDPRYTIVKTDFATSIVRPLYEAYKANESVKQAYPGADRLFAFILAEWADKS